MVAGGHAPIAESFLLERAASPQLFSSGYASVSRAWVLAPVRPNALRREHTSQTDKLGFARSYALNGDADDEEEDG